MSYSKTKKTNIFGKKIPLPKYNTARKMNGTTFCFKNRLIDNVNSNINNSVFSLNNQNNNNTINNTVNNNICKPYREITLSKKYSDNIFFNDYYNKTYNNNSEKDYYRSNNTNMSAFSFSNVSDYRTASGTGGGTLITNKQNNNFI